MTSGVINDGQARRIAADWHGGQASAMYALASTGHLDLDRVRDEIAGELIQLDVGKVRRDLLALDKYVRRRGEQAKAVPGWHRLWDDTPVALDQT